MGPVISIIWQVIPVLLGFVVQMLQMLGAPSEEERSRFRPVSTSSLKVQRGRWGICTTKPNFYSCFGRGHGVEVHQHKFL